MSKEGESMANKKQHVSQCTWAPNRCRLEVKGRDRLKGKASTQERKTTACLSSTSQGSCLRGLHPCQGWFLGTAVQPAQVEAGNGCWLISAWASAGGHFRPRGLHGEETAASWGGGGRGWGCTATSTWGCITSTQSCPVHQPHRHSGWGLMECSQGISQGIF